MAVVTRSQTVKQENFPSVVAYCKAELTALVVLSACLKISPIAAQLDSNQGILRPVAVSNQLVQ